LLEELVTIVAQSLIYTAGYCPYLGGAYFKTEKKGKEKTTNTARHRKF
jgi:hypothetical protein